MALEGLGLLGPVWTALQVPEGTLKGVGGGGGRTRSDLSQRTLMAAGGGWGSGDEKPRSQGQ